MINFKVYEVGSGEFLFEYKGSSTPREGELIFHHEYDGFLEVDYVTHSIIAIDDSLTEEFVEIGVTLN